METSIRLLDVVALTTDLPEKGLVRGQVGTVVEILSPDVCEVEFSDDDGRTYAQAALEGHQLMVLHYRSEFAGGDPAPRGEDRRKAP
jgi:hypothetical protein